MDNKKEPPQRVQCFHCNATFAKKSKLIYHMGKHTGRRPYVCNDPGCDKAYTNPAHLKRHKAISHGGSSAPQIMCEVEGCGLMLANKYSLKKHQNRQHNPDNYAFKCGECSQGFNRKKQLQQHLYLHTGEATFKCNQCPLEYTTSYDLAKHKRNHKTYSCVCGETFFRWSIMQKHKKTCHNKKYRCEVCDKTFTLQYNYNSHKLVHTEQSQRELFTCNYPDCHRIYSYEKNLRYHIRFFHEKIKRNKLKCTVAGCQQELQTNHALKQHLKRHFPWVKKKTVERKPRKDKGIHKKSMRSILTGIKDPKEKKINKDGIVERKCISNGGILTGAEAPTINEEEIVESNNGISDILEENTTTNQKDYLNGDEFNEDTLLRECDMVLAKLREHVPQVI